MNSCKSGAQSCVPSESVGCPDTSASGDDQPLHDARPLLPKASFFLGDLRDGLPMLNMQAVYLMSAKGFDQKQIGLLFLVFGLSQFLCMAPAGYFLDYSHHKLEWVSLSGFVCAALTVLTALTADPDNLGWMIVIKILQGAVTAIVPPGFNGITLGIVGTTGFTYQVSRNRMMNHVGTALVVASGSMIAYLLYPNIGALFVVSPLAALGVWYHLHQIIPKHVHRDAARGLIIESPTMNEYELADDVATCKQQAAVVGSNTAMSWDRSSQGERSRDSSDLPRNVDQSYLEICAPSAQCDVVSPPPPSEVARPRNSSTNGRSPSDLTSTSSSSRAKDKAKKYHPPDVLDGGLDVPSVPPGSALNNSMHSDVLHPAIDANEKSYSGNSLPSFNFGWGRFPVQKFSHRPQTPLTVLLNPKLLIFTTVIFFFHLANSSVLPLVMQSLALQDARTGILLSGLCILIAQSFMAFFAKLCGDYSPYWGRKTLMLVGLVSLTLRCFLLTLFASAEESMKTEESIHLMKIFILLTQLLDSVGAGIIGTLQILVTSDLSVGTGRFSLLMGVTTAAMCLGATVSGYLGQAAAQDYGYSFAYSLLGLTSLIPFVMYIFLMPETLPEYARPRRRRRRLRELWKQLTQPNGMKEDSSTIPVNDSPLASGMSELV